MGRIFDVLNVETLDVNLFRGPVVESALARTFGGQVAAQALVSATQTVNTEDFIVHSLHGYFVAAGDSSKPTIFEVQRIRDGRSFISRHITALQNGRPILACRLASI